MLSIKKAADSLRSRDIVFNSWLNAIDLGRTSKFKITTIVRLPDGIKLRQEDINTTVNTLNFILKHKNKRDYNISVSDQVLTGSDGVIRPAAPYYTNIRLNIKKLNNDISVVTHIVPMSDLYVSKSVATYQKE